MEFVKIYDEEDADKILRFLLDRNYEYHKPYMRFGKMVKVPRGQASPIL